MRRCSVACQVFMWIFIAFGVLMHVGIVIGLSINNSNAIALEQPDKIYNIVPMIIAVVRRRCCLLCLNDFASSA